MLTPFAATYGKHIIGGMVTYECLGNGEYQFTMTIYRDCSDPTGADFDNPAQIAIYQGNDNLQGDQIHLETVFYENFESIQPDVDNPCLIIPPDVCVEKAEYIFNYTFDDWPSTESYHIAYQRCCRNNNITNIVMPEDVGATFTVEVTPFAQAECSNSPVFNEFPPIVVCAGLPLEVDHSATDPDGDQIIYSLCAGLVGGSNGFGGGDCEGVIPSPPCPPIFGTNLYEEVSYVSPFTALNPMGGSPGLAIDAFTGQLTGTPDLQGQYVVGICASEFQNGQLLSVVRREFQFNVVNCDPTVVADVEADTSLVNSQDYVLLTCAENDIFIENLSYQEQFIDTYYWEFDINGTITQFTDWDLDETFPGPGIFEGILALNPGDECGDTATIYIEIFPEIEADFGFDYDTCVAGPVFFSDSSMLSQSTIDSWFWQFNEVDTSDEQNPVFTYFEPGEYPVALEITDSNGCKDTSIQIVNYNPVPALILISPNDQVICTPNEVTFNNLTTPINDEYELFWEFGDGGTDTLLSPTHLYTEPGVYSVFLEITSPVGCTTDTTFENLVEVQPPPRADFYWLPDTAITNLNPDVTFIEDSEWSVAWNWSVQGNPIGIGAKIEHMLQDTGWNEVTLVVTHPEGCQDTITKMVDLVPVNTYFMPNAFTPNEDTTNNLFYGKGFTFGATNYLMKIYNRWGEVIFETTDFEQGWNGWDATTRQLAPNGVYTYTVNFLGPRGKIWDLKGYTTLVK